MSRLQLWVGGWVAGSALALALPAAPWVWPLLVLAALLVGGGLALSVLLGLTSAALDAAPAQAMSTCLCQALGLLVLGCAACLRVGEAVVEQRLPHCLDGATVPLSGVVVEPVRVEGNRQRLLVRTDEMTGRIDCALLPGARLRLTWMDGPPIAIHDRLRLTARLRSPYGLANPGGFDAERWLFTQRLHGTGYVVRAEALAADRASTVRSTLRGTLLSSELLYPGILLALGAADPGLLSTADWALFRDSGTIHLMVISGLHIGIAWLVFLWPIRVLLALLVFTGLPVRDARFVSSLLALAASVGLVALSGAAAPALRAWIMLAVAVAVVVSGRRVAPLSALLLAFGIVVAIDPLALLAPGLWLSFAAVATLLLVYRSLSSRGGVALFVSVQAVLALVISPLVAYFNGVWVWQSVFANLLVVPIVSLLVVPLALLGSLLAIVASDAGLAVLRLADVAVHAVVWVLREAASWQLVAVPSGRLVLALIASVAGLLACLPLAPWLRCALSPAVALPLLSPAQAVPVGEFRLTVLDVGQGSAALVDTAGHRLIVDAGYRSRFGFDVGEAVVVPSFLASGARKLDAILLSHGDLDHSGGALSVTERLRPSQVLGGPGVDVAHVRCERGQRWVWDGVVFSVLSARHQSRVPQRSDNDGSCVVSVVGESGSALLPGDIGAATEYRLVLSGLEPVDVLVAPHHGSRSSSSTRFLAALAPREVIVSAGRGNRFGHPHPVVADRYASLGSRLWRTDQHGALSWRSDQRRVRAERDSYAPYWRGGSLRGDSEPSRR